MRAAALALASALALAGCKPSAQHQQAPAKNAARPATAAATSQSVTPMADRVAILGILNKRNGITREIALRPGQSAKWKDLIVRLRACETTAPWEQEKLTGAFVQVDVQRADKKWGRVFSGWLYKESPSLNVVEHPVYDVWPKSCAMTFPAGPPAPAASVTSSNRSSAPKSGGASPDGRAGQAPAGTAPTAAPPPSAVDSNAT